MPARGDRDGQVRWPRAELRQRRRRDLRGRARRGVTTSEQPAMRAATQLASTMMQVCSEHTREGTIWPVDANLRPEGKSGPLVRTLASHRGYYERWAKTWEFQALLKARPVAGDLALGREYVEVVGPLVWSAAERDGFVEEVQSMRRRVLDHIPANQAERQLKLGSGGLRDVEFAVQLLQMVHGRTDEEVRPPTTLSALARLTERRLRRARGRAGAARRLRVPAHARAPHPAATSCGVPTWCPRTRPRCAGSAARSATPRTRCASSTSSGTSTSARCAGCTRSCSTVRCSRRWRGSAATRRGSAPRRRGPGWPRSATSTRTRRCATSRRSPPGSPGRPRSSARCCR